MRHLDTHRSSQRHESTEKVMCGKAEKASCLLMRDLLTVLLLAAGSTNGREHAMSLRNDLFEMISASSNHDPNS